MLGTGAAAAGGALVGQISKIKCAYKVIGIAGRPEKCKRLTERYGLYVAIDYRGKTVDQLSEEIAAAAPESVNVIFENVGGIILDAGLMNLNLHSPAGLCGLLSQYHTEPRGIPNPWPLNLKRAHIRAPLVAAYVPTSAHDAQARGVWALPGRPAVAGA